jgi:hypothetical protein
MENTKNQKVWRDTVGSAGNEYIIVIAAIGALGIGGFTTLGGSMSNAIDSNAGGSAAAMVAAGAPADAAGAPNVGPSNQAAVTGVDVSLDCTQNPASCQAFLSEAGIGSVNCDRQPSVCEEIIAGLTNGTVSDPSAGNSGNSGDPDIRDGITGWLLDKASDVGTGIASDLLRGTAAVTGWFGDRWDNVKSIAGSAWDFGTDMLSRGYNFAKDTASNAFNLGKDMLSGAWNFGKSAVSTAFNFGKDVVSGAWDLTKSAASGAWNFGKSVVSGAFNFGKTVVSTAIDGIQSAAGGLWSATKWVGRGAVTVGKGIVGGAAWLGYQAWDKLVVEPFNLGKDLATGAWHVAGEGFDRLNRATGSFFGELFSDGDEKVVGKNGPAAPSADPILIDNAATEVADAKAIVDAAKTSGETISPAMAKAQMDQLGAAAEALKVEKAELEKHATTEGIKEEIARIDAGLKDLFLAAAALNSVTAN